MTLLNHFQNDFLSKAILITLAVASLLMFLPQLYYLGIDLEPDVKKAENGQILIKSTDLTRRNMVSLGGEWYFYWDQLLTNEEVLNSPKEPTTVNGIGGWQTGEKGHSFEAKGFATYHMSIALENVSENLALSIPHIETAYRLYVNNELLAFGGVVSESLNKAEAGYNSSIVLLPQGIKDFSINLQVSNFHSKWGGLWSPIILGDADSIYNLNRDKVAFSMFLLGVLLITAIHSLIQFYLMPSERVALVFACLCFILFLREMTNDHIYFGLSNLGMGFALLTKMSYLTFYMGFPVALYFIHQCYESEFSPKTTGFFYGISNVFGVFVLLSPVFYLGYSLLVFQLFAIVMMIYTINRIFAAARKKQVGARIMMVGVVIIFLFVLNDILNSAGVIATGRFVSLGIIGFIICQSYVKNSKFASLIGNNEELTIELKDRYNELELMSDQLETKVELRTQELKDVNDELAELASMDKLTKTLNRHGLQHHLLASFERFRRTKQVFSIVLLDYDNFKVINDTFGHDVGDIVLKTGSNIIKQCIREQDKLARWGGEEFLVLLPDTNLEGAKAIADKLRLAIQKHSFKHCAPGISVTVTGGIGIVQENETFEMIFKRVDTALYKGKHAGKNCIYG